MAPTPIDKARLFARMREQLAGELATVTESQRATVRGATHEEARAENDKDTRALEATYLARGLAQRVATLESASRALQTLVLRDFGPDDPIALGALVTLESEQGERKHYMLLPEAGGLRVTLQDTHVTSLTSAAPLGQALIGKHLDDEVEIHTPQGPRSHTVVELT